MAATIFDVLYGPLAHHLAGLRVDQDLPAPSRVEVGGDLSATLPSLTKTAACDSRTTRRAPILVSLS
jgi:hypothetical protein